MAEQNSPNFLASNSSEVLGIINQLMEIAANRGEPNLYSRVSSGLYRQFERYSVLEPERIPIEAISHVGLHGHNLSSGVIPIEALQNGILDRARRYTSEIDDFEILSQLQHQGGKTNLIDFTTDYMIALFFACDGLYNRDGRVVLLRKNGEMAEYIREPRSNVNRIIVQKSIFVRPPDGFVEPDEVVGIPSRLKQPLLEYMHNCHNISRETIYNDLNGFIRQQDIFYQAYEEYYAGMACQRDGDYDGALNHYTSAIDLNPQIENAYVNRGVIYFQQENFNSGIEDCNHAIELNPQNQRAFVFRGLAQHWNNDFEQASLSFTNAIELDSDDDSVYCLRGSAFLGMDAPYRAIEDFTKAIELAPENAHFLYHRGGAYLEITELDKAIEDLSASIELDAQVVEGYFLRGRVFLEQNKFNEAIYDFTKIVDLEPEYPHIFCYRGQALLASGDVDGAIQDYSEALNLQQGDSHVYLLRGRAYLEKGSLDEALLDYDQAVEIDSNLASGYSMRGFVRARLRDYHGAVEDYSQAIQLEPNNSDGYCNRGEVWLHLAEWEKARADLVAARGMGKDILASFRNDYESLEDFEAKNGVRIPEEIAMILEEK